MKITKLILNIILIITFLTESAGAGYLSTVAKNKSILAKEDACLSGRQACLSGRQALRPMAVKVSLQEKNPLENQEKMVRIAVSLASFGHGTNMATEVVSKVQMFRNYTNQLKEAVIKNKKLSLYHEAIIKVNNKLEHACNIFYSLYCEAYDSIKEKKLEPREILSWQKKAELAFKAFKEGREDFNLIKEYLSTQDIDYLDKFKEYLKIVDSMLTDRLFLMRGDISDEVFNLNQIFDNFFEHLVTTSGGVFREYFELKIPDKIIYIKGNKLSIISLICNLADNCFTYAREYREKEAKVIIEAKEENNEIVIRISDNGKEISAEKLKNIWKPFYTTGGTGIGLTEAQLIVKDHGGAIEVESELGKGTTFTIRLPLAMKTSPTGISPKRISAAGKADLRKVELYTYGTKGRRIAAYELSQMPELGLPILKEVLFDQNAPDKIKESAAYGLSLLYDNGRISRRALEILEEGLNSSNTGVSSASLYGLFRMKDKKVGKGARAILINFLNEIASRKDKGYLFDKIVRCERLISRKHGVDSKFNWIYRSLSPLAKMALSDAYCKLAGAKSKPIHINNRKTEMLIASAA